MKCENPMNDPTITTEGITSLQTEVGMPPSEQRSVEPVIQRRKSNSFQIAAMSAACLLCTLLLAGGILAIVLIVGSKRGKKPDVTSEESIIEAESAGLRSRIVSRPIVMSAESSIKRALEEIQVRSGNAVPLLIDRGSFENDPGYVFEAYRNDYPLLIDSVNFRDEPGMDCEGITNDFLSQSLSWYEKRDDPVMDVETGIICSDQNRTQIRDLSTFAVMCLAKEASARSNHVCSLTNSTLAPINIWLAMVDEDPHSPMFRGWKKNEIGSHFFSGKLKDWPDTDDEVQPFYVNILGMDEEEAPSTLREMVRYQTSNSSVIIRQVLRDYGLLSVVRSAFQTGTLMDELETLWKPAWNDQSGQRLKQKVADIVRLYHGREESIVVFGEWVAARKDDDQMLKKLWQHWSGISTITDSKLNRASIRPDNYPRSPFIRSSTCFVTLYIPNTLTLDNMDRNIPESLGGTAYGTA